jgi:hypothetical protein
VAAFIFGWLTPLRLFHSILLAKAEINRQRSYGTRAGRRVTFADFGWRRRDRLLAFGFKEFLAVKEA